MDVIINFIKHFKLVSPTGGPETESPSDITSRPSFVSPSDITSRPSFFSKQIITSLLLFKTLL